VDGVAPVRSRCCSSRRGIDRPRVASAASASDAVNARMSARMSAVARRLHLVMAGAPIGGGAESKSSSRRARWVRRVPAGRRGMDVPTRLATLSAALDEAATSVEGERARRCERRGARSGPSAAASAGHSLVGCNSFSQPTHVLDLASPHTSARPQEPLDGPGTETRSPWRPVSGERPRDFFIPPHAAVAPRLAPPFKRPLGHVPDARTRR